MGNIYILRHGQTFYNLDKRLGGNSELTNFGIEQVHQVKSNLPKLDLVIHSSKVRSKQSARIIADETKLVEDPRLDEISAGIFDECPYDDFQSQNPEEFSAREKDKYNCPWPQGESYATALQRVQPLIENLDNDLTIALVGHKGINRVILGYLMDLPEDDVVRIAVPQDKCHLYDTGSGRIFQISDDITEGVEFEVK